MADAGKVCAAVFQRSKERLSRCGSDRRGGATPNHEVRRNQDGRPARLAGAAPGARGLSVSARASSIRSAPSCWSAESRCGKGCVSCGPSCRASWRREAMRSHPACCASFEDLSADWRRLDARIEGLSSKIETLARQDKGCERPTLKLRYLSEMTQPDT